MKRGEVWMVELEPCSGSEQRGIRPGIIVSSDNYNALAGWKSFNVVPVTSSSRQARRSHTTIPVTSAGLSDDSFAICHQVTTVDRQKFIRKLGDLTASELSEVEQGLLKALGMLHYLPSITN